MIPRVSTSISSTSIYWLDTQGEVRRKIFVSFPSFLCKTRVGYFKLGHYLFLPHCLQSVILYEFSHSALSNPELLTAPFNKPRSNRQNILKRTLSLTRCIASSRNFSPNTAYRTGSLAVLCNSYDFKVVFAGWKLAGKKNVQTNKQF
jgi:hypothetical protein